MPHWITQCYLPPGRGDIPALTQAEAGTRLSDPEAMQGWVDLVGLLHTEMVYPPEDVIRPGTNRARHALTSFMLRTPLTTMPRHQPCVHHCVWMASFHMNLGWPVCAISCFSVFCCGRESWQTVGSSVFAAGYPLCSQPCSAKALKETEHVDQGRGALLLMYQSFGEGTQNVCVKISTRLISFMFDQWALW